MGLISLFDLIQNSFSVSQGYWENINSVYRGPNSICHLVHINSLFLFLRGSSLRRGEITLDEHLGTIMPVLASLTLA